MTLTITGITKRFGDLVANDGISLELPPGTLHAILGENGAGKSTLMKILSGAIAPDAGSIALDGVPVPPGSPRRALAAGIGMLHQEPLVCLPFTAAENLRLGRRLPPRSAVGELASIGGRFGFRLDPAAVTRGLSVGERQQLEMVRLLASGVRVLILDEPTSGITAGQRRELFSALRRLAAEGLTVLFVSHKLEEVNELCRSVTVLRRGRVVGDSALPRAAGDLVAMMFDSEPAPVSRAGAVSGPRVALRLEAGAAGDDRAGIDGAELSVREGEVVGLAGLEGSGQAALLRALAGVAPLRRGRVEIAGRDLTARSWRRFRQAGVAFLSGGRLEEGLLPGMTVAEHLVLAAERGVLVDRAEAHRRAEEAISTFRIKGTPDSTVEALSGGNQQRLLLALLPAPLTVLLMEHPTRGLDLESSAYVWGRLLDRRRQGTAIVFASSDVDELLLYADRILVCFNGRIIAERQAAETTTEEIGTLIGGKVVA